jgi:hypothetical protein
MPSKLKKGDVCVVVDSSRRFRVQGFEEFSVVEVTQDETPYAGHKTCECVSYIKSYGKRVIIQTVYAENLIKIGEM